LLSAFARTDTASCAYSGEYIRLQHNDGAFSPSWTATPDSGGSTHIVGNVREAIKRKNTALKQAHVTRKDSSQSETARSYTEGPRDPPASPDGGELENANSFYTAATTLGRLARSLVDTPRALTPAEQDFLIGLVTATLPTLELAKRRYGSTHSGVCSNKVTSDPRLHFVRGGERRSPVDGSPSWTTQCPLCNDAPDTQSHFTSCTALDNDWKRETASAVHRALDQQQPDAGSIPSPPPQALVDRLIAFHGD